MTYTWTHNGKTVTTDTAHGAIHAAKEFRVPVECTEEVLEYALNVLPPVYIPGWFGIGEAHSHTDNGETLRHWFRKRGGHAECFLGTKSEALQQTQIYYIPFRTQEATS